MKASSWSWAAVGLLLAGPGCYAGLHGGDGNAGDASAGPDSAGDESGGDDGEEPPAELECDEIGKQALRRISSGQYEQILQDVLPPDFAQAALAANRFPATELSDNFSTFAAANTVSTNESIAIEDNAEALADVFAAELDTFAPQLVPCLPASFDDADIDACMEGFVVDFGTTLFRRPPTSDEINTIMSIYEAVEETDGAEAGLVSVVQFFLQAPALLYVTEPSGEPGDEFVALSSEELAARLALLFLNSSPDAELLAAAQEGRLRSKEDVEREARRLVGSPASVRAFAQFHHEWMRGFELEESEREHDLWNDDSAQGLVDELSSFSAWFLADTDGTFQTLMTTEAFPVDDRLDAIYSQNAGEPGPNARHGLLTAAATMAALSHTDQTSLVQRGAFIRNHVMCIPVPPLPGNIDTSGPLQNTTDLPTARERLQPLMESATCAGCHAQLNPFGFPFEVYDWTGAFRPTENGASIDTSARVSLGSLDGNFANASELLDAIAATDEARDCYATHWFRYALGRIESDADECTLGAIRDMFADSGGDVRELLVAIAVSDAFRFRKVGGTPQ